MNEPSAFLARVRVHTPVLRRFARRLTGNASDADDVVQDALVRALEKRSELRDPGRLRGWLLAIVRTTGFNFRRGLRHLVEVPAAASDGSTPVWAGGDLEREIVDASLSDEVLRALESLPPAWRQALWLREVEGLSYAELAQVLGCPLGTVRSRLARARTAAALSLGKEDGDGV